MQIKNNEHKCILMNVLKNNFSKNLCKLSKRSHFVLNVVLIFLNFLSIFNKQIHCDIK